MHIQKLLITKLKIDIITELETLYDKNNILQEKINKETYLSICKIKLRNIIKNIQFLEQKKEIKSKHLSDDRCCARIWNNHYGGRCRYKKVNKSDYCRHHINVFKKNGGLILRRYDEDKPLYNINKNKIPWFNKPHIDILNDIVQKQHINLYRKIKIDLIKQC